MSTYVPYAARAPFADLVPVPQADGPSPLVPIAYTEQYRDAMDTFRALVQRDELSTRGLELTETLIRLNPGHYSIWAYRARILLETGGDLSVELDLMDVLVKEHLKSYQVWQHRRNVVTVLESSSRELAFTTKALSYDAKNYHTWAYRQWALCHFFSPATTPAPASTKVTSTAASDLASHDAVWAGEIEYVDSLMQDDVRNNSAWNHRFYVAFESGQGGELEAVTKREIEYVKTKLALAPNNPSAWNYLRGVLLHTSTPLATLVAFVAPLTLAAPSINLKSEDPIVSETAELPAYLAIEFLADALVEEAARLGVEGTEKRDEAAALFTSLVQHDPIRTKYWLYRAGECAARGVKPTSV